MKKNIALILLTVCLLFVSCKSEPSKSKSDTNQYSLETTATEQIDNDVSKEDAEYVASKNSNKYHRLKCRYVDNIKPENIVYYEYEYQATGDGKEPCSKCKP